MDRWHGGASLKAPSAAECRALIPPQFLLMGERVGLYMIRSLPSLPLASQNMSHPTSKRCLSAFFYFGTMLTCWWETVEPKEWALASHHSSDWSIKNRLNVGGNRLSSGSKYAYNYQLTGLTLVYSPIRNQCVKPAWASSHDPKHESWLSHRLQRLKKICQVAESC